MTPEQELKLLTDRLGRRKGIILLHDPKAQPPPCCRPSCAICGTTAIAWFMSCRLAPETVRTRPVSHAKKIGELRPIKVVHSWRQHVMVLR